MRQSLSPWISRSFLLMMEHPPLLLRWIHSQLFSLFLDASFSSSFWFSYLWHFSQEVFVFLSISQQTRSPNSQRRRNRRIQKQLIQRKIMKILTRWWWTRTMWLVKITKKTTSKHLFSYEIPMIHPCKTVLGILPLQVPTLLKIPILWVLFPLPVMISTLQYIHRVGEERYIIDQKLTLHFNL